MAPQACSIARSSTSSAAFQPRRPAAARRSVLVRADARDTVKQAVTTAMATALVMGQATFGAGPVEAQPTFIDVPVMSAAIGNAASNAARDLGRGVSDLGSDASGNAQSAIDSVKDAASDVAGSIKDAARQVNIGSSNDLTGSAKSAARDAKSAAKDAARQVSNAGNNDITSGLKNAASDAKSAVKSAARQVNLPGTNNAVDNAKGALGDAKSSAKDAASSGSRKIKQIGRNVSNTNTNNLSGNLNRATNKVSNKIDQAASKATNTVNDVASDAKSASRGGLFGAKQSAVSTGKDAATSIKNAGEDLRGASRGIFGQTGVRLNKAGNDAQNAASKAKSQIGSGVNEVGTGLQDRVGEAGDKAKNLVRQVTNGTADASSIIKGANEKGSASRDAAPSGPFDIFSTAEENAARAARAVDQAAKPAQRQLANAGDDIASSVSQVKRNFAGPKGSTDGSAGDPEKAIIATESNQVTPGRYESPAQKGDSA